MTGDTPDLVGVQEAARIVGIGPRGIRQAHHRGRMPAPIPVAGSDMLVWERSAIERWAQDRNDRREAHR